MAQIVAVANHKGGVAKTTTTANLAGELTRRGKNVLAIDLDPQAHLTHHLGVKPEDVKYTAKDLMQKKPKRMSEVTVEAHGVQLVPANLSLGLAEHDLAQRFGRETKLRRALRGTQAEIVLIDCPPSLGLFTQNALCAAQHLMIPVAPEPLVIEGLADLTGVVRELIEEANPDLSILGVLPTRVDPRYPIVVREVLHYVRDAFDDLVFDTEITNLVQYMEASAAGVPICHYEAGSKGAEAFSVLADEIFERFNGYRRSV